MKVQKFRVFVALLVSAFLLTACEEKTAPTSDSQALTDYLTEETYKDLREKPEDVSILGLSEEEVGKKTQHLLNDRSLAAERKKEADFINRYETVLAFDRDQLSEEEQFYYDVFVASNKDALALVDMPVPFNPAFPYPYRINFMISPHLAVPQLLQTNHSIETLADAEDYVGRLNAIKGNFADVIEAWNADIEAGMIPPKFALEKVSKTLANFVTEDPKTNPLYVDFSDKVSAVEGISDEQKNILLVAAEEAVLTSVMPGYADLKSRVDALIPDASEEAGIWARPGGDKFYEVAAKIYSGSDKTPDEIHEIGLQEAQRILAEIDTILTENGYTEGNLQQRFFQILGTSNLRFENSDEGRAQVIEYLKSNLALINTKTSDYFSDIPDVPVEIQRVPEFSEGSGTAGGAYYTPPTLDGSKPGIFWINLQDPSRLFGFALKTLLYHEAVPGHHFENSMVTLTSEQPIFRKNYFSSNYSEGWALYAEKLAKEMGAYENDPVGDLGRLFSELFRAVRLVVDTGMHAKKWSKQEAIDYIVNTTGTPLPAATSEIERYAVIPGQALGYKMGMLKILELREKAQTALGDNFDIKAFHKVILGDGPMPMDVLESKVDAWIAKNR